MRRFSVLLVLALFFLPLQSSAAESVDEQVVETSISMSSSLLDEAMVAPSQMQGMVREALEAGGYVYLRVATATGEHWIAAPYSAVRVGDSVSFPEGMAMENFQNKRLGRTFPTVLFVEQVTVESTEAPALSIAEIYARHHALAGGRVEAEGVVVKYTENLMSRNWIHLQDGTGAEGEGNNDLPLTTDAVVAVGDRIRVEGTVVVDKDFGYGYTYAVFMEDATVRRLSGATP